jgi:hypothetical protein
MEQILDTETTTEPYQITLADRLQDHVRTRIKDELTGFFDEVPEAIYSYYLSLVGIYTTVEQGEFTKLDNLVGEANAILHSDLKASGIKINTGDFAELTRIIKSISRSEIDVKLFRERQEKADNTGWNTRQYIDFLSNLGYTFKLNILNDSLEINGETTNTFKEAKIHNILSDSLEKNVSDSRFKRILKESALDNEYHPVIRYLERVRKRNVLGAIDKLCNHFKTNDDDLFRLYLKLWFVGAVERAYTGKQNPMLVLDGKQGIGKSWFTRWIAPDTSYYLQSPIRPDSKDCQMNLNNFFVWEVSELGSTTRKADVEALKDFITREFNVVRKPYEPENTKKKVLANFIGTINNEAGFLRDATGNRRFHVITVDSINFNYQKISVDDLWSEAATLYNQGFSTELTPEQAKKRDEMNQRYQYKTHLDEVLESYLEITHDDSDRISSIALTQFVKQLVRDSENKITKACKMYLSYFGIEKTVFKLKGKTVKGYKGIRINYD